MKYAGYELLSPYGIPGGRTAEDVARSRREEIAAMQRVIEAHAADSPETIAAALFEAGFGYA